MQNAATRIPVWLIILYVLALATILAWPFIAFMSVFAFDEPGSAQNPAIWRNIGIILSYPVLPIAGVAGSFLAYRKASRKLAYVLAGVGALRLAAFIFLLIAMIVMDVVIMLGGKL